MSPCRCSRRAGLLLAFGPSELYAAFAGLFGVLAAGALLTPLATVASDERARPPASGAVLEFAVTLAVRGVSASLSRTGVATAALAVAVATVNGVGLMIASFRTSLDDVAADDVDGRPLRQRDGRRRGARRARGVGRLRAIAGVDGLSADARTRAADGSTATSRSARCSPAPRGWGLEIVAGDAAAALRCAWRTARGVVASERLVVRARPARRRRARAAVAHGSRSACRSSARFATSTPASRRS